jgi:hypothetical protein
MASKVDRWREPPPSTHSGGPFAKKEVIKAEENDTAIAIQRMADALNAQIDQLHASSEGRGSQLDSRIKHLNDSVERSQRELLTKLDQLQTRLKAVEAQAAAAAVSIKKAQTRAALKITPAPDQTNRFSPPQRAPEVDELPRVRKWSVWEVVDGTAVLEGPEGFITVSTGDVVPGAGRVEAIVRRGGRWVVATTKGTIFDR